MKTRFHSKILIALTLAVAGTVGFQSWAGESTASITQTSTGDTLPDEIQPGTPAAQVVKLAQAGVDTNVIQTYITNCSSAFNLNADKIIALSDAGVSGDMINAMIAHDKNFLASLPMAEPPAPAGEPSAETSSSEIAANSSATTPPPEPVSVNDFYNTLNPYGSWINVDGYGLCWRPTVVVYNSGWRPYCDRGHWVYTDYGWFWDSDYAWGITFHYGRWFHSARYGWCWWPDTVWAPSWVTWRSGADYCGWAPLPPFAAYQPGIGFTYLGKNVSVSFGFGLASSCFTFVSAGRFCDPHPWQYCVPVHDVEHIYGRTAVCNDFGWHDRRIVNHGVSVTIIGTAYRHPIRPVSIGSLVNVHRPGWHHYYNYNVRPVEHHESRSVNTSHYNEAERRNTGGYDHRQNAVPHNGNDNHRNNERSESFRSSSPSADRHDYNHENRSPANFHSTARDQAHGTQVAGYLNPRPTNQPLTPRPAFKPQVPVIMTTPPRRSKPNETPAQIVHNSPTRSESHGQVRNNSVQHTPNLAQPTPHIVQSTPHIVQSAPRRVTAAVSTGPALRHTENKPSNGNNGRHQEWASRDQRH